MFILNDHNNKLFAKFCADWIAWHDAGRPRIKVVEDYRIAGLCFTFKSYLRTNGYALTEYDVASAEIVDPAYEYCAALFTSHGLDSAYPFHAHDRSSEAITAARVAFARKYAAQ